MKKIQDDAKKMVQYRSKQMIRGKLVKLWFITEHEPTADQRTEALSNKIEILSLTQFQRRILDADGYLELRKNYRFGSATDPDTDSHDLTKINYQPTLIRDSAVGTGVDINAIAGFLINNEHVLLLGDYGVGKSLTLRQVFLRLRELKNNKMIDKTPILINLRDHWGQKSPAEVLERHANEIGFTKGFQLVRALNAGKLIIMLDGFDETAAIQWSLRGGTRLREARRAAVLIAKKFAELQRGNGGFIISGRDHFFDNHQELFPSLGLRSTDKLLTLDGFSLEEMREFLLKRGVTDPLPEWLPNRPLLLAYLSKGDLLGHVLSETAGMTPSRAWDLILDRIYEREASIHENLGADSIRRIMEELASEARKTISGIGPIFETDIFLAFRKTTDMDPDDAAKPLLMRLPGLSARDNADGGRTFLDDQMLDVLRAGVVTRFATSPFQRPDVKDWRHGLGVNGIEVSAAHLRNIDERSSVGKAVTAANEAAMRWGCNQLAFDLVLVSKELASSEAIDFNRLYISGATTDVLDLSEGAHLTGLSLDNITAREFYPPQDSQFDEKLVMKNCLFEEAFGITSVERFPTWMSNCDAMEFADAPTNAEILRLESIPVALRVALTILRKLYKQRGRGRQENALSRGMDLAAQEVVDAVLGALQTEGLAFTVATSNGTLWHPVHGQRRRANEILDNPYVTKDNLMERLKKC